MVSQRPVGVLALQGGYEAHTRCLQQLGLPWQLVKCPESLSACSGLILPGGESTTHLRLIERFELAAALDDFVRAKRPVLATCAGLILAAATVTDPSQRSFNWIDVDVQRNGWGRQVHSFEIEVPSTSVDIGQTHDPYALLFIRAPRIVRVGPNVKVVAQLEGEAIAVRERSVMALSFHPELKGDSRFHAQMFSAQDS